MRFDPNARITWPAGHVIHMELEHAKEKTISVATCDCGWVSRKQFGPAGYAKQDYACEVHWRLVEDKARHIKRKVAL